jgi:hypothetical protein
MDKLVKGNSQALLRIRDESQPASLPRVVLLEDGIAYADKEAAALIFSRPGPRRVAKGGEGDNWPILYTTREAEAVLLKAGYTLVT